MNGTIRDYVERLFLGTLWVVYLRPKFVERTLHLLLLYALSKVCSGRIRYRRRGEKHKMYDSSSGLQSLPPHGLQIHDEDGAGVFEAVTRKKWSPTNEAAAELQELRSNLKKNHAGYIWEHPFWADRQQGVPFTTFPGRFPSPPAHPWHACCTI